MYDKLKPYLARWIASLVAAVCTWLAVKYGLKIDSRTQQDVVEIVVLVAPLLFSWIRETLHRAINAKLNPIDAASPPLAKMGQEQLQMMRETGAFTARR